jgi:hypothetical protein
MFSTLKVERSQIFVWGATRRNLQARPKILKKIIGTSNQPIKQKNRALWMIDADKCLDFTMCSIIKRTSRERIVVQCTATLKGEYNERLKIFKDGSLNDERVGYAIVTPETTIKNQMKSQTTIFSAKQEAIIKAIYIFKGKRAMVIATDSLSTMMAVRDGQKTHR